MAEREIQIEISPKAMDAVRMAKEKMAKEELLNAAKKEQVKINRRERMQKFSLRIKNGLERTVTWFEDDWANLCYDGLVIGSATALFGTALSMFIGSVSFMSLVITLSSIAAAIPIAVSIVYWAVKGSIMLGKAVVNGIKKAALKNKETQEVAKTIVEGTLNQKTPPLAGAEATA